MNKFTINFNSNVSKKSHYIVYSLAQLRAHWVLPTYGQFSYFLSGIQQNVAVNFYKHTEQDKERNLIILEMSFEIIPNSNISSTSAQFTQIPGVLIAAGKLAKCRRQLVGENDNANTEVEESCPDNQFREVSRSEMTSRTLAKCTYYSYGGPTSTCRKRVSSTT